MPVLALLFFCVLLPRIDSGTLWQHDELLAANRAQEMLVRGNPWSVTFDFAPDFKKPPLQYWLTAVFLRAFPAHPELAVRLPALLGGTACLLALAWLAAQAFPEETPGLGFYGLLALAGCGYFVHHARTAYLDTGAALCVLLALAGCQRARRNPRWWWFVGACCTVGAWQKAPFAFGAWLVVLAVRGLAGGRNSVEPVARTPHLARALGVSVFFAAGWWFVQGARYGFPAVFAAMTWQTHELLRVHSRDAGFRPYLYWLWMARDWALFGLCAPVAVASALRPATSNVQPTPGTIAAAELGWVCAVFLLALVFTPFRVERYLVVITPLLALLSVRWLCNLPGRVPRLLPASVQRWVLPVAVASTLPVAAWHYVKAAPARFDLRAAGQDLGRRLGPGESALISVGADPDAEVASSAGFYAQVQRPWRELTPDEIYSWPPPSHGLCHARQWAALQHACPTLRQCAVYQDWVVWERVN